MKNESDALVKLIEIVKNSGNLPTVDDDDLEDTRMMKMICEVCALDEAFPSIFEWVDIMELANQNSEDFWLEIKTRVFDMPLKSLTKVEWIQLLSMVRMIYVSALFTV